MRPAAKLLLKACCAGALFFGATTSSEGCLFPCLWPHWGWGPAYPPPPVYAPVYAPAYPSPCGPGGCSPCGPGGCGVYYGPSCSCAPCACSPCGFSGCGSGGCATGNCGLNYSSGTAPIPDPEGNRTYSEEPESTGPDTSTETMPDDDFEPTRRNGTDSTDAEEDPFTQPVLPMDGGSPAPMDEDMLEGNVTLRILPVRTRVHAQAQYRVPRVARLPVTPSTPWSPAPETRVATK